MLRDHSYLIYTKKGLLEFRQKEKTALSLFLDLLYKKTGIRPPITDIKNISLISITEPSYESAKRLVKRIESLYNLRAKRAHKYDEARRWSRIAYIWYKILSSL